MGTRLKDAALDKVPVPVALERLARVALSVGNRYLVVNHNNVAFDGEQLERAIGIHFRKLFARGVKDAVLRSDLTPQNHSQLFGSLLSGALESRMQAKLGIEQAAAVVTSLYLDGGRAR